MLRVSADRRRELLPAWRGRGRTTVLGMARLPKPGFIMLALAVIAAFTWTRGYRTFMPARALLEAHLEPGPVPLLVTEQLVGSSASTRQSLRFELLDARTGARVHRVLPSSSFSDKRSRQLGGGARQWWGYDDHVVLLDLSAGSIAADEGAILSANPALRGELHRTENAALFKVDAQGALLVQGGSGAMYAIDPTTLAATAIERLPKPVPRATSVSAPREIDGVPASVANGLVLVCRTTTAGPCGLHARKNGATSWTLGEAELQGKSVLDVAAQDGATAYVYVADDSTIGRFMGGTWIYAVTLATGAIAWKRKL